MNILDVKQGSQEWHDLRKVNLGASCAPIIMGVSDYMTPFELYQQMKGLTPPQEQNWGMERGKKLERDAVFIYEQSENIKTFAPVIRSKFFEYLIASMDAVCVDNFKKCAEIKCIDLESHYASYRGEIPDIYYPQLQHQMYVCELDQIDYVSYHPDAFIEYTKTIVKRDETFLQQYIPKALAFMECIYSNTAPEKTEKDIIDCSGDEEYAFLEKEYMQAYNMSQQAEKEKERTRLALIEYAKKRRIKGEFLQVSKYLKSGTIDYKKIPEIQYLNLDKYRSPPVECYRITRV